MLSTEDALGVAVQRKRTGQFEEAEAFCRELLAQDSTNSGAAHMLAMLKSEQGRHEAAVGYLALAIALDPKVWRYHYHLGRILQQLGRYQDAVLCYEEALHLEGPNPELLSSLAIALAGWGYVLRAEEHLAEAAGCWEEALRLKPEDAELHNNLGALREQLGDRQQALNCYRCAIAHHPAYPEAHVNLGRLLREQGQLEEAEHHLEAAIRLNPQLAPAHNNLGAVREAQGREDEAAACYCAALRNDPQHAPAHNNLGNLRRSEGRLSDALACYQQALKAQPSYPEAHWNRALALLVTGDFERGWPEYPWRLRLPGVRPRQFSRPAWNGAPLEGRTILLHAEQGLGDTIQFVRYASLVAERGGRVLLECQPLLVRLLETVRGINQVIPAGLPLPDFDLQTCLLDLPAIFDTRLETIPANVPYLEAKPAESWGRAAVGLVWAGNQAHANDRNRSLTLPELAPLGQVPGVNFFSLQKGPQATELLASPPGLRITDLAGNLVDFADTAAAILGLDLVITVDTAVAHLAGALGRKVWTLLPFAPDWRWLLDREDSPWYPTMRLFRQPRPGDWATVIEDVAARLSDAYRA